MRLRMAFRRHCPKFAKRIRVTEHQLALVLRPPATVGHSRSAGGWLGYLIPGANGSNGYQNSATSRTQAKNRGAKTCLLAESGLCEATAQLLQSHKMPFTAGESRVRYALRCSLLRNMQMTLSETYAHFFRKDGEHIAILATTNESLAAALLPSA